MQSGVARASIAVRDEIRYQTGKTKRDMGSKRGGQ